MKIYVDYPSKILIELTPWAYAVAIALSAAYLAAWATYKLARAWFNWKLATPRAVLADPLLPLKLATNFVAYSRALWAADNAASAMLRLAWASSLAWVARLTAFLAFLVAYLASINLLLASSRLALAVWRLFQARLYAFWVSILASLALL